MSRIIDDFGAICAFEDPEDCAMFDDSMLNSALDDIEHGNIGEIYCEEDTIDTSIDYSDIPPEATQEDMDSDDFIGAARDLDGDPSEDDEILDHILGDEDDIPELFDED